MDSKADYRGGHVWRSLQRKKSGWISEYKAVDFEIVAPSLIARTRMELLAYRDRIEARQRVKVTDAALDAASALAAIHFRERDLPDRAVELLEESCYVARARAIPASFEQFWSEYTEVIEGLRTDSHSEGLQQRRLAIEGSLSPDELRRLERMSEIALKLVDVRATKEEAIDSQEFEYAAKQRDIERSLVREMRALQQDLRDERTRQQVELSSGGSLLEVDVTDVVRLASEWTGVQEEDLETLILKSTKGDATDSHALGAQRDQVTRSPSEISAVYRALRKGREDQRDAPGAADFYYGEMEMRRHAASKFSSDRALLWMYWIVSGYGLRASRALITLAVTIGVFTVLFQGIGFEPETSWNDSALYVTETASGLLRQPSLPAGVSVTDEGRLLSIVLRLLGPVLLALALLAVRGRLRR